MSKNDISSPDGFGKLLNFIEHKTKLSPMETIMVSLYPTTIFLGKLLSLLSKEPVVNYYTNKNNLINTLFVRNGWFWTILALSYFKAQTYTRLNLTYGNLTTFAIRLSVATIYWYLFTQWFFGLPIMDRIFMSTGGACEYDTSAHLKNSIKSASKITIGSMQCRKMKGEWTGGHDPSGHVFILVLSSILLSFEFIEAKAHTELLEYVKKFQEIWNEDSEKNEDNNENTLMKKFKNLTLLTFMNSSVLVSMLLVLWWWMLYITSTHFHSFPEKITGLVAGSLGVLIYIIPRLSVKEKKIPQTPKPTSGKTSTKHSKSSKNKKKK